MTSLTRPEQLCDVLGVPFSAEQLRAATAALTPQLIVAGAGTGKTTVMAARVVWLVGTGQVQPHQVLGLTFTNKASAELRSRIRQALSRLALTEPGGGVEPPGDPTVLTYNAFATRLVAEFGPLLGLESDARALAPGHAGRLAYRVACQPRDPGVLRRPPRLLAQRLRHLDDDLAGLDVDVADLIAWDRGFLADLATTTGPAQVLADMRRAAEERLALAGLVSQYRDAKLAGEWLDFGDQTRFGSLLAQQVPLVAARLRESFAVVLLDEYQDTSRAQRRMLQGVFGHGHPVTAVGDPCQAIYGWRGASVTNIDQFPDQFRHRSGEPAGIDELSINRRSRPAILAAANRVADPLREVHTMVRPLRAPVDHEGGDLRCALLRTWDDELLWLGGRLAAEVAQRPAEDIAVLCRTNAQVSAVITHLRAEGLPVQVTSKRDLLALPEVVAVVGVLRLLVDPYANPDLVQVLTGPRFRIGPRDLALLSRRARDLATPAGDGASAPGPAAAGPAEPGPAGAAAVGASEDGPAGTATSAAAASAPGAADRPAEDGSAAAPAPGQHDDPDVRRDTAISLLDAMHDPGPAPRYQYDDEARRRFQQCAADLDRLARLRDLPLADQVAAAVDLVLPGAVPVSADRVPDSLGALVDLAQTYRGIDGERDLDGFVSYLDDCVMFGMGLTEEQPPAGAGIRVMTMHAAKGLEFPVVAVPFLSRLVFPAPKGADRWVTSAQAVPPVVPDEPDPALQLGFPGERFATKDHDAYKQACRDDDRLDEDRLAYVAVTRAKDVLIGSGHWWGPEQATVRGPSPYLEAIRQSCAQWNGQVDEWVEDPGERPGAAADAVGQQWPHPVADAGVGHLVAALAGVEAPLDPANPWHPAIETVVAGARAAAPGLRLPTVMSASDLLSGLRDPDALVERLRRPMPRRPSRGAALGTAFHRWIEQRGGQQALFELPGTTEPPAGVPDAAEFERRLAATRFADRVPHAIEAPFALAVAGRVIVGRIDAVFAGDDPDIDWEVVDWKTGDPRNADPMQLAVYRSAWAAMHGVDESRVRATFVFLADGSERSFLNLPAIGDLLAAAAGAAGPAPRRAAATAGGHGRPPAIG